MQRSFAIILTIFVCISTTTPAETDLLRCDQRPHFIDPPWVSAQYYCAEEVIHDESGGEPGFTSLAAAPDGTLYAARPLFGQVVALTDSDRDGLPEKPRIIAKELTLPNGLAFFEGALYIAGGSHVYRLIDDQLDILVADLPTGTGFWTGGIAIGIDKRIYVSIGAACDFCISDNPERGTILSFALDGTDRRREGIGLRQPNDLTFRDGELWTVDAARDGLGSVANLDELNRVRFGAHFGWPFCVGLDRHPDTFSAEFDCETTAAPALAFETHSNPMGITAYTGEAFPHLKGSLLVTLGGSYNEAVLKGYTLVTIGFDSSGNPLEAHIILPEIPDNGPQWTGITLQKIHYQASGFWPHRPYDVTVSREGWIYVSVGGGRIWALRPR